MKTVFRLVAVGLFITLLGFCVFGLVATYEPMPTRDRIIWRTVYSLVGITSTLGLFRLLRGQCLHWLKHFRSHSNSAT